MATELELDLPSLEIDFLILADRAEAINGKLYLMGGAWDRLGVREFSQPVAFSIAIGVLVPWNETNIEHPLTVHIEHEDGSKVEPQVQARINMGRPPVAVPGQSLRALLAINGAWLLPKPDTYTVVATLAGRSTKRVVFHAHPA